MSESKTPHGPGCWEDPEHGECARIQARAAINHIHEQQKEIASLIVERDALAARVEKAEASRWQPIETCPESCQGEYPKYVLFYNGYHIGVGFCYPSEDGDGGTLYLDETDEIVTPRPTHWMPPPLPPGNDAALSREEKS